MEIIFIAIALAMDSAALCMANTVRCENFYMLQILKMSFIFSIFQGAMTVFGYYLGLGFVEFITSIDHFIAFGILVFLGYKMIKESGQKESEIGFSQKALILGAVATSIDALAIGVTFSFQKMDVILAAITIGFVCFILCILASYIGKKTR